MAVSDRDITIAAGEIPAGRVAGIRRRWEAIVSGRAAIVFVSEWKMADGLTPPIREGTNRYVVELLGEPGTSMSNLPDSGTWGNSRSCCVPATP
jgi:hypothetical protein